MKTLVILAFSCLALCSCGVKGKPLPPDPPREIGIGKPQYKGVDKELLEAETKKEEEKKK